MSEVRQDATYQPLRFLVKAHWTAKLWLCSLGTVLLIVSSIAYAAPAGAKTVEGSSLIVSPRSQKRYTPEVILKQFAQANVVYLGETHDRPADHEAQLELLQALFRLRPTLAIGMEMFQRPYQSVLDRYVAGDLTVTELQERSQYQQRWGYPWKFYAPILQFAQQHKLPVIALNTPTEVTRKVARTGLESLTPADRRFIPPTSAIAIEPGPYRDRLQKIYDDAHHGRSNSAGFERFFQAQVLWDETMAERIAQTLQQNPEVLIVVLVGQGHIAYGDGIPDRVARRIQSRFPSLSQVTVLLNPPQELQNQPDSADYFWYSN